MRLESAAGRNPGLVHRSLRGSLSPDQLEPLDSGNGAGCTPAVLKRIMRLELFQSAARKCLEMFQTAGHSYFTAPASNDGHRNEHQEECPMTLISARSRRAICLGLGMLPLLGIRRAAAQEFQFRLGHPLTEADAVQTAMLSLADNLKKKSDGRIDVTVFPADELGAQADLGEMVRQGAAVIQLTDALFLGQYVPDVAILQAPYLMDKPDDFLKILDTPWLKDLENRLAANGMRVISWNNYFGTRQILSKKPIRKPADMAGMNFRVGAAPMYVDMVNALGARPITTGFAETYTGLAQGSLDMMEAPLPTIWASKFYEQAKYVVLTGHMIGWDPVVMSEAVYSTMPPDLQKIILEEAGHAADLMTKLKRQQELDIIPTYKAAGVTVIEDVDRDAFRRATAPIYDHYPGFTPGIKATVQGLLAT
jgi:tripartite ATP-independent transporter DctP family solute receptor